MKRTQIIGVILIIIGLVLAWFMTNFFQACIGLINEPMKCTIEPRFTYLIGVFYIVSGIGIGLLLSRK